MNIRKHSVSKARCRRCAVALLDLDSDGAPAEPLRRLEHRAAAAEGIDDEAAGRTRLGDDALHQVDRLLRRRKQRLALSQHLALEPCTLTRAVAADRILLGALVRHPIGRVGQQQVH
jgi:hypothetical protein